MPYSVAVTCPICHGPSISFPRHQCFTLWGSAYPCFRRKSLHCVPLSTLQYSRSAAACSGVPVPRFRPISGKVPTALHHCIYSLVPNWLEFIESQALSSTCGRPCFGPTPSSQLYPETKLPPG